MALETFDFSSFSLRSLRVFFWTSRLQAWHLLGRKECEESVIPAMSGGATPAEEVEHPGCFISRKKSPS